MRAAAAAASDVSVSHVARVPPVRNGKAVLGVVLGLLAIAILVTGAVRTNSESTVDRFVVAAIPAASVVSLLAISCARRGRFEYQRSLGRRGGRRIAGFARLLGVLGLLLSLTGALALAVFGVLQLVA